MLSKLDSAQISEYMAYDRIESLRNDNLVFMLAQLTALLANVNGGKSKISDFIPKVHKPISVMEKVKAVLSGSRRNKFNSKD